MCGKSHWKHHKRKYFITSIPLRRQACCCIFYRRSITQEPTDGATCLQHSRLLNKFVCYPLGSPGQHLSRYFRHSEKADGIVSNYGFPASKEPLEFPAFMTAFEPLIESKVEDSCERLYFLGQYTSGKAKEGINGCLQRKSEGSCKEAKGLLKKTVWRSFQDCKRPHEQTVFVATNQSKRCLSSPKFSLFLWTEQSLL